MAGLSAATDQTVYSIVCPVLFGAFLLRTGKGGHLRAECIYAAISLDAGKGDRQSIRPQLRGGGSRSCHQ